MAKLLSPEEIKSALAKLDGWSLEGSALTKIFTMPSFTDIMVFVNEVAQRAEDTNHHPDIFISYNTVKFTLTSHDAHGITDKDIALASKINDTELGIEEDEA